MYTTLHLHLMHADDHVQQHPPPPRLPAPTRRRRIRGAVAARLARTAGRLDRDRAARALFPGW
jgi:hypothetical protein